MGMVRNAVRSLLAEPRAPDRTQAGVARLGARRRLLTAVVLEGVLREDVVWRPVALALAVAVVCALLWRRTHPLAVVAAVFGALIVVDIGVLISGGATFGLYTMICVVLLPYSLVRWGSGREILIGLAFILVALVLGIISDFTGYVEAAVGSMFLLFPATLGAAVRYRWSARVRELDQVRLREREQLARELHDTVAHHVSAIVIRAQAGRAVAATRPEAAVDALAVIEAEGTRTLAEMRTMVGVLRETERRRSAPQPGVADLERLARSVGDRPRVEVEVSGDLEDLGPAVGAAIYRIAQESITNAVRHARQATRIDVRRDVGRRLRPPDCPRRRRGHLGAPEPARLRLGRDDRAGRRSSAARSPRDPMRTGAGPSTWCCRERRSADDDPRTRRRRPGSRPDRTRDDPRRAARYRGGRSGGRRAAKRSQLARRLRPDVCLFDIRMPGLDGIAATRELAGPGVDDPLAIVVITTFDLDEYVYGALKAGARGFLLKDAGPDLLVQAIHAAANGDALIAPKITARLLAAFSEPPKRPHTSPTGRSAHTREEQVLIAAATGRTNAEIADELHISLSTVKTHLTSVMGKVGARNRVEIAMWAYETGRIKL